MTLHSILRTTLSVCVLSMMANQSVALPIETDEPDTQLLTIELVLLHSTQQNALTTEAWNNPVEARAQIQAELDRKQNLDTAPATYSIDKYQSGALLEALKPILRPGKFDVIYSTRWQQPKSQKRNTHDIETSIDSFGAYNFAFGQFKLEERSALVAKLDLNVVDTLSLAPPSADDMLIDPSVLNADVLNSNVFAERLNAQPESYAQETDAEDMDNMNTMPSIPTPLLFLRQQRQVKLDKVHYFDHPVIPGFLLVSMQPSQSQ